MKWLSIIFTVLSSANVIGDLVRTNKMDVKVKNFDKKMNEREMEFMEKIDNKMKNELGYLNNEINSLKVVVKLLFILYFAFFILFLISLIFFIFILKYKNVF